MCLQTRKTIDFAIIACWTKQAGAISVSKGKGSAHQILAIRARIGVLLRGYLLKFARSSSPRGKVNAWQPRDLTPKRLLRRVWDALKLPGLSVDSCQSFSVPEECF